MPLDAVAVSCGPGSYTGLRIGVSMAKGICYGRNLKLIGLPTLKVQCVPVLLYHDELPDDALLCPMIDARRMEEENFEDVAYFEPFYLKEFVAGKPKNLLNG